MEPGLGGLPRKAVPSFKRERERLILVSNREPFEHHRGPKGEITVTRPAGGLTSALQPIMESSGGAWVAWGSGSADFDVVDEHNRVRVPPEKPTYDLIRIPLNEREVNSYYVESANRALWPLCHLQFQHFAFDYEHWQVYRQVNHRFAHAVVAAAGGRPATVWVQDYHLAYVPGLLRRSPNLFVHQFWHIPFPPADVLSALPVARRLLRGMIGNDLLVFQVPRYAINFLSCVAEFLPDADVDVEAGLIRYGRHRTKVTARAISIDVDAFEKLSRSRAVGEAADEIRRQHAPRGDLILGVDRIDYSKGIPSRFNAFSRLLEDQPQLRGKVTLVQIAVPSRLAIDSYRQLERSVIALAASINQKYRTKTWQPVVLIRDNLDARTLAGYYRAADICMVSSLQDGMNLVAKEFIACQVDGDGALLLSRFAGAAEEMDGAILINPYDVGAVARSLSAALEMSPRERRVRIAAMRQYLHRNTIYDWMEEIFADVARLRTRRRSA
ncbi:MAG: trehalose-6-phosphate synthase [Gemmatimonadales bacterium]